MFGLCCQDQRRKRHCEMKEHVSEVSGHLELELGEEFAELSNQTAQFVYSTDNMNLLKQTFKKVHQMILHMDMESVCVVSSLKSM